MAEHHRVDQVWNRPSRHPRPGRITAWAVLAVVSLVAGLPGTGPAPAGADPPRPVLLVGGTGTLQVQMDAITFLDADHDVHAMTLSPWVGVDREVSVPPLLGLDLEVISPLVGLNGAASMATSARAVEAEVARILDATGAEHIDLVGHSQAAPVIRYYVKFLGGSEVVAGVVSLGGVNYGIPHRNGNLVGDLVLATGCALGAPVCEEIVYDGELGDTEFLRALNEPDPTPGDIDYYHLWTETDESPGGILPGAVNVKVQDMCPGRAVYHADEWNDEAMQILVAAALERSLDPDALPPCPD